MRIFGHGRAAVGFDYADSASKDKTDKDGNPVLSREQLKNYVDEPPNMLV